MERLDVLKKHIRELVKQELSSELLEMTTTGDVAGYLTPRAFTGDKKSNSEKVKSMAKRIGYTLTKRGEEDVRTGDSLTESSTIEVDPQIYISAFRYGTDTSDAAIPATEKEFAAYMATLVGYEVMVKKLNENYYAYRNDETRKPHQKIGQAISEINKQLKLVERALKINHRLQKEQGIPSDRLWKRTQHQMTKLEGKLIELAGKIREMRS